METFTLDPRRWLIARVLGHNPLLRRSDRIEALVILIAVVVSLVAVPLTGVVGAMVYSARSHQYTAEMQTRHTVTATVIDSNGPITSDSGAIAARVRWQAGGEHVDLIQSSDPVEAGEHIEIWVDADGNLAHSPTPGLHAVVEAAATTLALLLSVAIAMKLLVAGTRLRVDQLRDVQWDREIQCLQDNDGGRTNQY